ncbi:MAG: hypothetical protein Q7S40_01885 [Opitutaceae bacterium]|nr:hypothetical protein [Opitutaceae bacterium]
MKARPFHISTFGLSPDMKRVHPAFGSINRGDVSRQTLFDALETYRRLDSDCGPSASHITVQAETGRFVVRVSAKQLLFAAEAESRAQAVPLAPEEIVRRLEQPPAPISIRPPAPPPEPPWRLATALVVFAAGVGLIGYALKALFVPDGPRPDENIAVIPGDAPGVQLRSLAGTFATGQLPGDRRLAISENGYTEFAEIGPRQRLGSGADSIRIRRRDNQTFLDTTRSGIIEFVDKNTLRYYGDTYRRLH